MHELLLHLQCALQLNINAHNKYMTLYMYYHLTIHTIASSSLILISHLM